MKNWQYSVIVEILQRGFHEIKEFQGVLQNHVQKMVFSNG